MGLSPSIGMIWMWHWRMVAATASSRSPPHLCCPMLLTNLAFFASGYHCVTKSRFSWTHSMTAVLSALTDSRQA